MLTLYTHNTPNGYKISIALEELGVSYETRVIDVRAGEQFKAEFLDVNPNAKIPVLADSETGQTIWESGAILLYLAEKSGQLLPLGEKWQALQWLFFQTSNLGPMLGQRMHFAMMAKEKLPYAIERYTREVERLYDVMETHLSSREYFLSQYSIVDIAHFGWLYTATRAGISMDKQPSLAAWYERIAARPAAMRGVRIPSPLPF